MWCSSVVAALLTGCPAGDDGESVGSAETTDTDDPTTTTASTTATTTASTTESTTASTTASTTEPMTTTASMTTETDPSDTDTTDTDTTDSDTDTDTGGAACGNLVCNDSEYCDWSVNSCGVDRFDEPVCTPIPDGCAGVLEDPVCGCDGIVYSGECAAAVLGVDVDEDSGCTAPDGLFECGYKYCDSEISYCQVQYSDVFGYPNSYGCMPLPQICDGQPSCSCLEDELCGTSCEASPDGGLIVSCAGG